MKVAFISLGSISSQWTSKALSTYFDQVDDINLKKLQLSFDGSKSEILYDGNVFDPIQYDCIYAKGSFRFANLLAGISTIVKHLGCSYLLFDPSSFSIVHDKLLTQLELEGANIPMPKTFLASSIDSSKQVLKKMTYPVILKFPKGTQGKGVLFADSYASASSILDAMAVLNQPLLIQEYIESGGCDVRAFVVGDKVVASMLRRSNPDEKRANLHAGGVAENYYLNPHLQAIAVKVAKTLKSVVCGVDILVGPKGAVIIEANISPGLQGITKSTGVDIADEIAKYVYKSTRIMKDQFLKSGTNKIFEDLNISSSNNSNGKRSNINLISNIEFRGSRILLPELISNMSVITTQDDLNIYAEPGKITIEKL